MSVIFSESVTVYSSRQFSRRGGGCGGCGQCNVDILLVCRRSSVGLREGGERASVGERDAV